MSKKYVQYGCGLQAPKEWLNFDASPTLRIQKIPIIGKIISSKLNVIFPSNVLYGDIIKGLPGIEPNSCDGVFCSHVLEHLSLSDFRVALQNTYEILKPGGIFRCILPDLEKAAKHYLSELSNNNSEASISFLSETMLGSVKRYRGLKALLTFYFGNSQHLFMWDRLSLESELRKAGFQRIQLSNYNESKDEMFKLTEVKGRFENAICFEVEK